jgi:3alpha(or 20beta)-hydroxysteroid dehydrogenase
MGRVSGKVAIVTGAARGMGAAFARSLVSEGAKVMLTDVHEREGLATANALGANARFLRHDVTKEAEWKSVIADTETAFGPVSVLVNNAGIVLYGPIENTDESDYRKVIEVNQIGVFLGLKSIVPTMKRAGGGSIINMSSIDGLVGSANGIAYIASKFAVRGMSKAAAIEFAPYRIRVNSIHPGIIRTPMTVGSPKSEQALEVLAKQTLAGRFGEPDEIANVVLLLSSDESLYATGAEFVMDGGITCQ